MKKQLTLAIAAAALALTACGDVETTSDAPTESAASAKVMNPSEWGTLADMADTIHAVNDNCPQILTEDEGMGGCGNKEEGFYFLALNSSEFPNATVAHRVGAIQRDREDDEVMLLGDEWSIQCWGSGSLPRCEELSNAIPSAEWVDLEAGEGIKFTQEDETSAGGFSDGTHMIGTDIQPGTYRTDGGEGCYWERLSGFSGTSADRIANDFSPEKKQSYVTIEATDKAFESKRCGTWELVE